MAQNFQSLNEQNVDNVQYKTNRPSYKWGSGESQGGIYMKATWDYQDRVHSDGSHNNQAGRLDHMSNSQKQLKGAIRLESTQIR
jgi:hypothetical protein